MACLNDSTEPEKMLHALPLTPNGKVEFFAVSSQTGNLYGERKGLRPTENVAPRDTVELQLTKIWEEVLEIRPIGVRDNFFDDLGGHSMLAMRLFRQIEKSFGKDLPVATLFEAPTVEQLASILRQSQWSAPTSSLVAIQPGGDKPPIFCVPAAGTSVLIYRDLAQFLGPEQPFYGLELLNLDDKQFSRNTIEDMAAHYITEIRTIQPNGPYLLGGYCFGGYVAFEMAQQLHAQGQKVSLLALFDAYLSSSLKLLSFRQRLSRHFGNLLRLGPTYLLEKANKRNPLSKNRADVDPTYAAYMAYVKVAENYTPQLYPGRVSLFRASNLGEIESWHKINPQLGWGELAGGGLETYIVPGQLHSMFKEPQVQVVLAEKLRACLDAVQTDDLKSAAR